MEDEYAASLRSKVQVFVTLTGEMLLGNEAVRGAGVEFYAANPADGTTLEPGFAAGSAADVDAACALAAAAFDRYRETGMEERAAFLETIAEELLSLGDTLLDRAGAESGLPRARLENERARTVFQLRLYAGVVRSGDWLRAAIDLPLPDRKPLPRVDVRRRHIPLGPVAVFGASNFPFAYSVAGGDTASALAAGCPVVAKSHPAHPGTSELAGRAIQAAVRRCGLHPGVFSLVLGDGNAVGEALVSHPAIQAVGFTGSRRGGLALARRCADRPQPIPIYAEMSSVNPIFLLPGALQARAEALGRAFVDSLTLGVGQFCTNPGLVFGIAGAAWEQFAHTAAGALTTRPAGTMLHSGIAQAYAAGCAELASSGNTALLAQGAAGDAPCLGRPALFRTTADAFLADAQLRKEVFGPVSLLVTCADAGQLLALAEDLEGQLTATLHLDESRAEDLLQAGTLLPVLERKAGRLVINGFPTGVEVCEAIVHGGPYPATTDARTTSVGTRAIERWLRPVCYQSFPPALLPVALQTGNPLNIPQLVNGVRHPHV